MRKRRKSPLPEMAGPTPELRAKLWRVADLASTVSRGDGPRYRYVFSQRIEAPDGSYLVTPLNRDLLRALILYPDGPTQPWKFLGESAWKIMSALALSQARVTDEALRIAGIDGPTRSGEDEILVIHSEDKGWNPSGWEPSPPKIIPLSPASHHFRNPEDPRGQAWGTWLSAPSLSGPGWDWPTWET